MSDDDGFIRRWSRRKADATRGVAQPAAAPTPAIPQGEREEALLPPAGEGRDEGVAQAPPVEEPAPPTMDDVAALPSGADVRRFLAPKVDEDVKRAALKKLFADPRFNVMDGLDTYIDDYSQPDPIPLDMLRKMAQAHALGLFDDEEEKAKASPDGATPPAVPQSATASPAVPPDEDPDLRLQQDDAAGSGGAGEGPPA